jgi:hypothetical protein
VRQALKRIGERARQLGLFAEFASAIKALDGRLRSDPLQFGEALYTLRNAGLAVRTGAVAPLAMNYGVDRIRRIVYVSACWLLEPGP